MCHSQAGPRGSQGEQDFAFALLSTAEIVSPYSSFYLRLFAHTP